MVVRRPEIEEGGVEGEVRGGLVGEVGEVRENERSRYRCIAPTLTNFLL